MRDANDLADLLRDAADTLEYLAARTTPGRWRVHGPLATRPDVIAYRADGSTEHVAEAPAGTADWITTMSPAIAPHLARWLRHSADHVAQLDTRVAASALAFAAEVLAATTM